MDDSHHLDFSTKGKVKESSPEKAFNPYNNGSLKNRTLEVYQRECSLLPLRHVLNKELPCMDRLFWLIVLFAGAVLCSLGMLFCWKKMTVNMLQIVVDEAPSSVWIIPFPAVTICGQCLPRAVSLKLFCQKACWGGQCACCEALFAETKTEQGVCFTFNNVAAAELFNRDEISNELVLSNASQSSENWSLQTGYEGVDPFVRYYPRRAFDLSSTYELKIKFKLADSDTDHGCNNITLHIHNPTDFPFRMENLATIEPGQSMQVAVQPKTTIGRRHLKFSIPQNTMCYFGDSRQLRFFRIYTQQNCELECRTNYFVETRNCVLPYMPRPIGVQVCNETIIPENQLQREIMIRALSDGIPPSKYFVQSCACLPKCNEISYKSVASKSSSEFRNSSEVSVHFEKDYFYGSKITIRYGIVDFLAASGGLLSLFLGLSFVSLIEFFYHCTFKPKVL